MPRTGPRLPLVAFKTPHAPAIDAWALTNGFVKGTGARAVAHSPDKPEPNRSEALNELVRWALENHPGRDAVDAGWDLPKLTDRDRQVLAYLSERPAAAGLQSEAVDADRGIVAMQTAKRLERLGLVETYFGADDGMWARLTEAGAQAAEHVS